MNARFADTFFFLALLVEEDDAHERAVAMIDELSTRLLTTTWVLTEVGDAIAVPQKRAAFVPFLDFLRGHPLVTIVPPNQGLFDRGVDLYGKRPDKSWSLTDCISFVVMGEHGLQDALTGDHHFEQAGFTALLK